MYKYSYSTLLKIALDALQADPVLQQYAIEHCNAPLAVWSEMPTEDPPRESDCPLVAVSPVGGALGQGEPDFVRELSLRVAVSVEPAEDAIETADERGRVVRRDYAGVSIVSDLLELIYDALAAAFNRRDIQLTTVGENVEAAGLGLYQAHAELGFHLPSCIGERRPDEDEQ